MKRLLIALLFVVPSVVLAAPVVDRDVLLTADGVVYTIEMQNNDGSAAADITEFLRLSVQRGSQTTTSVVPESLKAGLSRRPTLAFDAQSNTLFVFWLRMPNAMSSELLVSAYHDGKWSPAVSIDNKAYTLRDNLQIAVRHQVAELQADGSYKDRAGLVIHTVWWEQTGDGELARYALVGIDSGRVSTVELHDLNEFITATDSATVDSQFNNDLLKHSAIIDTMSADSVDIVFGDLHTHTLSRITLRPIADSRIHIPIGRGGRAFQMGAPQTFSAEWSGKVSAVVPGHDDGTLLMYNVNDAAVSFLLYENGKWATVKTVPLNEKLSSDAAIAALKRMLNQ